MASDAIELEKQKLELEARRLDILADVQAREISLKEKQFSERTISAPQATVAGALLAVASGLIGALISSSSDRSITETNAKSALATEEKRVNGNLKLENTKQEFTERLARLEFETSLILGAIQNTSREEAIRNLRFFVAAGFISDKDGKIASLRDEALPSKEGPTSEDVLKAFEATVPIQFLGPGRNTGYCTAVVVDKKHLLTAGFCDSNRFNDHAPSFAQYSNEVGVHNLSLLSMAAEGGIALLRVSGSGRFTSSIDWALVRDPVLGEPVYMAVWNPSTNRRSLRKCTVTELAVNESSFSHDCDTGAGSSGSLILSAIDDAPLGIHNGVIEKNAPETDRKPYAAQLTKISQEISSIINVADE